jgi:hypothetical protein
LHHFDGISGFHLAENGEMSISAARGRAGPKDKSPFDSLIPILYRLTVGILRLSLNVQKLLTFSISVENAVWKLEGRDSPRGKKIFFDETPQKHFLWFIYIFYLL